MPDLPVFYQTYSRFSDPEKHSGLFDGLPDEIPDLCRIVHGLIIHRDNTEFLYGYKPTTKEYEEANTRYIDQMLMKIISKNPAPLVITRKSRERGFGSCRDFSLLLCSILRSKKIPARLRCGFAAYFEKGLYWDHWICEYWNTKNGQWIMVDPEIGNEERKSYYFPKKFDPQNLMPGQFFNAGQAWQICRKREIDPNLFGVHSIGIYGAWFIRANVLRDLAALNKVELLPWDYTKYAYWLFEKWTDLPPKDTALIDTISSYTANANNNNIREIRKLYRNSTKLKVGATVKSFSTDKPKIVSLKT